MKSHEDEEMIVPGSATTDRAKMLHRGVFLLRSLSWLPTLPQNSPSVQQKRPDME
jgi:hypothetical protein